MEGGDLIKQTVPSEKFLDDTRGGIRRCVTHTYIRKVQRDAIARLRSSVSENPLLVLHFDFAENWSVILFDEIQSYHWCNVQISLFTCVTYFGSKTQSFVVTHDSAHALCALHMISNEIESQNPFKFETTVYISDGAAGHFKNRYQPY